MLKLAFQSSPRCGGRSGGLLGHAFPRGADGAADGLRGGPGGEPGQDQVPPDGAALHLRVQPGVRRAAGGAGGPAGVPERR